MDPIAIHFLLCTIVASVISAVAMWVVCTGVHATYARSKNVEEYRQAKKSAFGYKVAATVLLGLPSIFSLILMLFAFLSSGSSRGNSLYGLIIVFCSIGLFISFLASLFGYDYLFFAKSNRTASLILALPFFPVVFTIAVGFIAGSLDTAFAILSALSLHFVAWIVMQCLLIRKRNSLP
jgi:hypothetical protein